MHKFEMNQYRVFMSIIRFSWSLVLMIIAIQQNIYHGNVSYYMIKIYDPEVILLDIQSIHKPVIFTQNMNKHVF